METGHPSVDIALKIKTAIFDDAEARAQSFALVRKVSWAGGRLRGWHGVCAACVCAWGCVSVRACVSVCVCDGGGWREIERGGWAQSFALVQRVGRAFTHHPSPPLTTTSTTTFFTPRRATLARSLCPRPSCWPSLARLPHRAMPLPSALTPTPRLAVRPSPRPFSRMPKPLAMRARCHAMAGWRRRCPSLWLSPLVVTSMPMTTRWQ